MRQEFTATAQQKGDEQDDMDCPYCNFDETKVVDSRGALGSIRRRRQCIRCEVRFTTYEKAHLNSPFMVIKADGRREPFSHGKLEKSVQVACVKRRLSALDIERMVSQIETNLYRRGDREIESRVIGEIAMRVLSVADRVAYIRYASVYLNFQDEHSFIEAVNALKQIPTVPTSQMELDSAAPRRKQQSPAGVL